jgi:SAM-dependent methyltransferase
MNFARIYSRLTYDSWRRKLAHYGVLKEEARVLECGMGPGNLLGFMEEWFPQSKLTGMDLDYPSIYQARQAIKRANLLVGSAESLPFADGEFDLVLSFHMIEHLSHPEKFLSEANRVLQPGGTLVLATPNPRGLGARLMGSRWSSWHPEHISLKDPDTWRGLLNYNGFLILANGTTGLSGIPIFRKLPLGLLNWGPLFIFGFFPWRHGEAYMCICQKRLLTAN